MDLGGQMNHEGSIAARMQESALSLNDVGSSGRMAILQLSGVAWMEIEPFAMGGGGVEEQERGGRDWNRHQDHETLWTTLWASS